MQLYSSGTTGLPKGACLSNGNLCRQLDATSAALRTWDSGDVNLVVMPQFHIAGCLFGVLGFHAGARNVIMHDVDPPAILETIARQRVTMVLLVPAVILFMLQTPGCAETDFSSLKEVLYGASPIAQDLLRRARQVFACDFGQVYGLTETTGPLTYLPPADHAPERGRALSCGRPLPSV